MDALVAQSRRGAPTRGFSAGSNPAQGTVLLHLDYGPVEEVIFIEAPEDGSEW